MNDIDIFTIRLDPVATGERIRQLRIENHLTVSEMAKKFECSENAIFKWQRGECLPNPDNLLGLRCLFGVSLDDILIQYGAEASYKYNDKEKGEAKESLLPVFV